MDSTAHREALWPGAALLVGIGIALGLGYNALGRQQGNDWGIAWIGVDAVKVLKDGPTVEPVAPEPAQTPYVSDDPLAGPAVAEQKLPVIMDVGRPVQIHLEALKQLHDADAALIVDSRERSEYEEGHIPGSISLPYDEVITDPVRIEQIDSGGRPIVTYCGGGTCEVSLSLAAELIFNGHSRVAVYMGGFPEWERAGYDVKRGGDVE